MDVEGWKRRKFEVFRGGESRGRVGMQKAADRPVSGRSFPALRPKLLAQPGPRGGHLALASHVT